MNNMAVNKTARGNYIKKEAIVKKSLLERVTDYICENMTEMAPGLFAMNNTYYRPF